MGFSYRSCFWLFCTLKPAHSALGHFCQSCCLCPHDHFSCALEILSASLSLLPRALGRWALPSCPGSPGSQALPPLWEGKSDIGARIMQPLVTGFKVCGLLCCGLGDRGPESWLSSGRNSVPRPLLLRLSYPWLQMRL